MFIKTRTCRIGNEKQFAAEKNLFDKKNIKSNLQTIFLGGLIMTKTAASFNTSCMMAEQHTNCLLCYAKFLMAWHTNVKQHSASLHVV